MLRYTRLIMVSVLLVILLVPGWTAWAAPLFQGTVSLSNAGFEAGTADGWVHWSKPEEIVKIGKDIDINNSWYTPMIVPNGDSVRVRTGSKALEINNEYRKWRGGVYQTVKVAPGTKLVFKVWAQGYSTLGKMIANAGIDPNGGTARSGAVWSGAAWIGESYVQLATPEVTVGSSGEVTVFLLGEAPSPADKTAVFFDDASLEITGQSTQPTEAPKPPAQPAKPTSPPVVAQPLKPAQPQPDGSIVYTVQPGDTLLAIALAHGTTVDDIMQLNGLSNTLISVGQRLVIRGSTVQPTATVPLSPPPSSSTPVSPTAEPAPAEPVGQICIRSYNDRDGDGQPGGVGEDPLPGVVFALSSAQGALKNYTTDGINEPYCFAGLLPGAYTVNIVAPNGYNATTPEIWNLAVAGGQTVSVTFGARRGEAVFTPTAPVTDQQPSGSSGRSFFATVGRVIIGGLAIVVLIGLGAMGMYFVLMRR